MSNEIKLFENNEFGKINTMMIDSEPWLFAKEVCEVLGIQNAAVDRFGVDEDDIRKMYIPELSNNYTLVNESGFYCLVMRSHKAEAKRFKRWVTSEVLPSIRKTGAYQPTVPQSLPEALRLAADLAEKNIVLALDNKVKDQMIGELKPKADYTDRILSSKGTVPITAIAKDYGMSGQAFNKLLHEKGIQYKQGEIWFLYAKFQDKGYTHSKTFDYRDKNDNPQTRMSTEWTQKGRLFLYNLLKDNDVLPLIEM